MPISLTVWRLGKLNSNRPQYRFMPFRSQVHTFVNGMLQESGVPQTYRKVAGDEREEARTRAIYLASPRSY